MKARPCLQAGARHHPVHQERRPGHVAEVLEQDDEEEQDHDLRQEHQHAADAGDDPVRQQALQQARGHVEGDLHRQPVEPGLDQVHGRIGPAEHRLEHQEQDRQQDQDAGDRVQQHAVDLAGPGVGPLGWPHRQLVDAFGRVMRGADGAGVGRLPHRGAVDFGAVGGGVDQGQQVVDAPLARGHGGDDRAAQLARQGLKVDVDALALGDVDHVQRQHHRLAGLFQLQQQAQHQAQVGGVGHGHQQVRRAFPGALAEHDVAGDFLVGTARAQGIGARQVQHRHPPPGGRGEEAFLALHRDAGVVGDLGPAAGEGVEQGGLAAVGIADQGDPQVAPGHGRGDGGVHLDGSGSRRISTP